MLFMTVFAFEPEKRNEVLKRRAEKGEMVRTGVKVIGEWRAISGGRVFRLVKTDDPKGLLAEDLTWGELGKVEIVPVIPVEEVFEVISRQ